MKVLFLCKQRNNSYGVSFGLLNSANFASSALRDRFDINTKIAAVIDGNCIDRELTHYKPKHAIIEALWVTPAKIKEIARLHPNVKLSVRIHSKTPFLANEGIAFEWINGYREVASLYPNVHMSANNKDFVDDMRKLHIQFDYLPNIYEPKLVKQDKQDKTDNGVIDICCFGAIRPMKNHLQQAVAAIIFADKIGKKLNFHINGNRVEQRGEEVLKNLRNLFLGSNGHKLIEHPWMNHADFVNLSASMDLGMQVSMSESFNIVTADLIYNNVPVVVSDDVDWVPSVYRVSPTDTQDIVDGLELAWLTRKYTYVNTLALLKYNIKSLETWAKYIFGDKFSDVCRAKGVFS